LASIERVFPTARGSLRKGNTSSTFKRPSRRTRESGLSARSRPNDRAQVDPILSRDRDRDRDLTRSLRSLTLAPSTVYGSDARPPDLYLSFSRGVRALCSAFARSVLSSRDQTLPTSPLAMIIRDNAAAPRFAARGTVPSSSFTLRPPRHDRVDHERVDLGWFRLVLSSRQKRLTRRGHHGHDHQPLPQKISSLLILPNSIFVGDFSPPSSSRPIENRRRRSSVKRVAAVSRRSFASPLLRPLLSVLSLPLQIKFFS